MAEGHRWRIPAAVVLTAALVSGAGLGRPAQASMSPPARPVSPAKALGASLLIPGWGQRMTGHAGRGRLFLVAEAAVLTSFIAFRVQGEVSQERYIDYAEIFADIQDAGDKPDGYYRNVGRYASSEEYEDDLERDARARFDDDIAARQAYVAERALRADESWAWRSLAHREEYTEMRRDSRNAFRRSDQMIGLVLLNHVLSAVDAGLAARRGGRASNKALYVSPGPDGMSYVGLRWTLGDCD